MGLEKACHLIIGVYMTPCSDSDSWGLQRFNLMYDICLFFFWNQWFHQLSPLLSLPLLVPHASQLASAVQGTSPRTLLMEGGRGGGWTDTTETSDRVTLSVRVLHYACDSRTHSVLFAQMSYSFALAMPCSILLQFQSLCVSFRLVTVIKILSLSYRGLKLTANDQSLAM